MIFLHAFLLATIWSVTVTAAQVTFRNKHYYYFDVDGNAIDSTNGKVEWVRDQYFWIGEADCENCFSSLSIVLVRGKANEMDLTACSTPPCDKVSYSSSDLVNWYYNGPCTFYLRHHVNEHGIYKS